MAEKTDSELSWEILRKLGYQLSVPWTAEDLDKEIECGQARVERILETLAADKRVSYHETNGVKQWKIRH